MLSRVPSESKEMKNNRENAYKIHIVISSTNVIHCTWYAKQISYKRQK